MKFECNDERSIDFSSDLISISFLSWFVVVWFTRHDSFSSPDDTTHFFGCCCCFYWCFMSLAATYTWHQILYLLLCISFDMQPLSFPLLSCFSESDWIWLFDFCLVLYDFSFSLVFLDFWKKHLSSINLFSRNRHRLHSRVIKKEQDLWFLKVILLKWDR